MSHILIADDDAVQLDLRKGLLQRDGHEVSTALTAAQTMRLLERRPADLIILDLRFPNAEGQADSEEGLDLIRRIRERGITAPLIVLSGWPDDLDGRPEERLISRVLMKPVKSSEFIEAVREMIA
jgi:CheY-like chemotaxis protein